MADWRAAVTDALLGPGQPPAAATTRPAVLGPGNPLAAVDWEALNAIVRDQVVRLPACRMVRRGQLIDPRHFTEDDTATSAAAREIVVASKVARLLGCGASLVLQDLQRYHEPVRVLTRWLAWRLGVPVFVNAFATPAHGEALTVHSDPYGAWLLQTHGCKDWRVWSPGQAPATDPPALEVRLTSGDALWIPRRWVHHGVSTELSSIHLTLALRPFEEASQAGPAATSPPAPGYRERFLALPVSWPAGLHARPDDTVHVHPDGVLWRCERADGSQRIVTADDDFELGPEASAAFGQLCGGRSPLAYRSVQEIFRGCPAALAPLLRSRLLCTLTAPLECRLAADDG